MNYLVKTLGATLSVVMAGTVLLLVPSKNIIRPVMAAGSLPAVCIPVHGTIHSVFTTQNCTSPVGLCTTGAITGAGFLNGTTTFAALDVAPSAGLPPVEPAANLVYSGQLTIATGLGTLVTNDLGVLDASHLAFSEIERPASGTGFFANPGKTAFFISGSLVDNGQGFQGDLTGTVCIGGNE